MKEDYRWIKYQYIGLMEMEKKLKNKLKIFSIAFSVFILIIVIGNIFVIIINLPTDDRISAKEGYDLLMSHDKYLPFEKNITEISSRGLSKNGKADNWFFDFKIELNGSFRFFNVNVAKNGTCYHFDNQTGYIDDHFIEDWEKDSTEIIRISENLDCVRDFYKDNRLPGASLVQLRFELLDEYRSRGCIAIIEYYTGGAAFFADHEMWVYLDGTTGEFVKVVYYR